MPSIEQVPEHIEPFVRTGSTSTAPSESDLDRGLDEMMPFIGSAAAKKPAAKPVVKPVLTPAPLTGRVGCLSVEERRAKLDKYKEKRKRRSFAKRISYDCRKKVADKRLRIKGRFVTKEQAINILGNDHELLAKYFPSSN